MTIKFQSGDLFDSKAEALVNTVNCVGVMGKGVALEFKKRWPENFKIYKRCCESRELRPGKLLIFSVSNLFSQPHLKYVVNFPTKDHWRSRSKIEYIEAGLEVLVDEIEKWGIKSIAMPPLGCGNGGLDWDDVRQLIVAKLAPLENVSIELYGPAPSDSAPEFRSKNSRMTLPRATFIKAISAVEDSFGGAVDRLSAQKVAYFLQQLGVPLNLSFEDTLYGPYSDTLKRVLFSMSAEGQIDGFLGDGRFISITGSGFAAAEECVQASDKSGEIELLIGCLGKLLQGYDSPYGLELLSTVHFHSKRKVTSDSHAIVDSVYSLGDYRRNAFPRSEIVAAVLRLADDGLLDINPNTID